MFSSQSTCEFCGNDDPDMEFLGSLSGVVCRDCFDAGDYGTEGSFSNEGSLSDDDEWGDLDLTGLLD